MSSPSLSSGSVPFALIRTAVVNRVASAIGSYIPVDQNGNPLPPPWVRPVASDDYQITATENWFAYVRVYGPSPINAKTGGYLSDQGAGRLARNVSRRIRIYLYSRVGMDVVGGDEVSLGGTTNSQTINTPPSWPGHDILEELVLNALDEWCPTYVNSLTLATTPLVLGTLHWIDSSDGPAVRPPENEVGLIRSHLDFEAVYILSINNNNPASTTIPAPINNPM
jgi:hypothetical protein